MAAVALEQLEAARLSCSSSSASRSVSGATRKRTSPSTSTWMPPRPKATSGPNSGSSVTPIIVSTPPVIIGWMRTPSSRAVTPVAAAQRRELAERAADGSLGRDSTRTAPASVLCRMRRAEASRRRESRARAASAAASSAVCASSVGSSGRPNAFSTRRASSPRQPVVVPARRSTSRQSSRASSGRMSSNPQKSAGGCGAPVRRRRRPCRARARRSPETRRRAPLAVDVRAASACPARPSRRRAPACRRAGAPAGGDAVADRRRASRPRSAGRPARRSRSARRRPPASSAISIARRYASGPADATMSTGLPTLASGGRNARRRARVASENSATVEPRRFAGVDRENAGSAGVGDDGHAPPGGQRLRVEARRDVEHLVDRVGADHAGLLEERVDRDVAGGQRRRVAARGARAGPGAAGLHRDDRLGARDPPRDAGRSGAGCRTTRGTAGSRAWPGRAPSTAAGRCPTRRPCCRR